MTDATDQATLELRKLKLEERRYLADIAKWAIAAVGAVISFWVIDLGKLKLEEYKSHSENQRLLLQAYLTATEAVQPDVWKRKLRVIQTYSDDYRISEWASKELQYIQNYAARDALYRETLKVASQLAYKTAGKDVEREKARSRFEQLYWADLPYAEETSSVSKAMVDFRTALATAEANERDAMAWKDLDQKLLFLSRALLASQPKEPQ